MDRARWERLKALFDAALGMERDTREAYLLDACAGDDVLYRDVASLLAAHSSTFLEAPPLLAFASGAGAPATPEARRSYSLIGKAVGGYRIVAHIGSGGMGDVYRAEQASNGEVVAIKRLSKDALEDPKSRLRFEQEARVAMSLRHANAVRVRELIDQSGELFLVMDYVEGRTLRKVLDSGEVPMEDALDYTLQIMAALVEAHALGIIHRDVKPDNVMIAPEGKVKLLDFGLVKLVEPENLHDAPTKDQRSMSREGIVLGSASYMSPEQINGEPVDGRSDVFAVGAILYEMLSGKRAFTGATAIEIVSSVLWDEPGSIEGVNPDLDEAVKLAIQKRASDRYPSMAVFRDALAELATRGNLRVSASKASPTASPPRKWLGSLFSGHRKTRRP